MVVLFLAFLAFGVLILGSAFAHYLNSDPLDTCWGDDPYFGDDNPYVDADGPCEKCGPFEEDGSCRVCGWITEPVGSDFAPTGSTPTGTISSGDL